MQRMNTHYHHKRLETWLRLELKDLWPSLLPTQPDQQLHPRQRGKRAGIRASSRAWTASCLHPVAGAFNGCLLENLNLKGCCAHIFAKSCLHRSIARFILMCINEGCMILKKSLIAFIWNEIAIVMLYISSVPIRFHVNQHWRVCQSSRRSHNKGFTTVTRSRGQLMVTSSTSDYSHDRKIW